MNKEIISKVLEELRIIQPLLTLISPSGAKRGPSDPARLKSRKTAVTIMINIISKFSSLLSGAGGGEPIENQDNTQEKESPPTSASPAVGMDVEQTPSSHVQRSRAFSAPAACGSELWPRSRAAASPRIGMDSRSINEDIIIRVKRWSCSAVETR